MQFSTAAVHAAEEQREAASKEAHRQALFPALSSSSAPIKPAATNASGQALLHSALLEPWLQGWLVHDKPFVTHSSLLYLRQILQVHRNASI